MSVSFHVVISISLRASNEICNPVATAPGTDLMTRSLRNPVVTKGQTLT
jgi:hypothetical protein